MRKSLLLSFMLMVTAFAFAQEPATFDDVQLGGNGLWVAPEEGENELPSGGWIFTNYNYTSWGYWGGFTVSNRTDLTQSGLNAQYTAASGCGYDGSSNYAVSYTMGVLTQVYAADGLSHTVSGCYVTNNLWTYQDILQGGYGELPYGGTTGNDPDWFKLTAIGEDANGQTVGQVDFYLADYRFANNEDDYVLNTWEWFDLSPLGPVATITFELSSSRGSGYNMITPAYFCMDNFNGGGAAPDLPPYIANPVQDVVFNEYPQTIQVNLDGVATDPDDPDENITYSIVNNSTPTALTATMNGKILVMTRQNANQGTVNLTMRATSDGQSVDFIVHVIINSLAQQLCGTYVIDADATQNPDFTSFNEAVEALSAGVSCEVIFEVAPGTYEEYVTINSITGASDSHRVIFRGMGTDNQQVVLTSNAGYTSNSTLTLDGTDYVTIENMTLSSTSENTAIVVTLRGGLTSDRFENVRFVGCYSDASNTDNNKNLVYRVSGGWMDINNAFVDCEFVNGFIGLYYQGTDMTQYNDGLLVENCSFTNQCSKSIYATFTDHVTLTGNLINNSNDTHTDYNAIDMFRCRYGCLIENNVMNVNHPTKYATVVKLRPCTGTAAEPIIVRNNIVEFQGASSSWCYSFDNADSEHVYFAHNTGKCSGTGGSGNLFVQKDWEHFYAYNNLLVNETSGYVFRFNVASDNRFCDYNRVSFMGSNIGIYAGTDCATLADWTSASGFDSHTAICTPQFVGNNDLHITSSEGLTVANPLSYVTTDIDGEARSNMPCAGADEYVTTPDLPPYIANPVQDVVFNEYPQTIQVNLDGVATDPDDPDENITYSVINNTNSSALYAHVSNKILTMIRQNADQATADLTIRATSDGQHVDFNVHVIINAVIDEPPFIMNPVEEVLFEEFPQAIEINLDGVATDPDDPDEGITYSVVSNPNPEALTATMNGKILQLVREMEEEAEFDLAMRANSDGQFVDFNIHVIIIEVEGVGENAMRIVAYPNPTSGMLYLSVDAQQFDYEVYSAMGQAVMSGHVTGNETSLDLGDCPKGVYFISIICDGNRMVRKVIVR